MVKSLVTVKTAEDSEDNGLNVLFLAAFPLVLYLFQGSSVSVFTAVLELLLLAFALILIAQGRKYQAEYEAAKTAMRPGFPRKVCGSILIGLMVLILAGHHFVSLHLPLLMGVIATTLSISAFGIDPMRDKEGPEPGTAPAETTPATDGFVDEAEARLQEIADRVAMLQDPELTRRTAAARDMVLRLVRAMDRKGKGARRVLQKPVTKFAEILSLEVDRLEADWSGEKACFARRRFVAKLQVLAESFETHARKRSTRGGRDAFDFEADLLLDRMQTESAA